MGDVHEHKVSRGGLQLHVHGRQVARRLSGAAHVGAIGPAGHAIHRCRPAHASESAVHNLNTWGLGVRSGSSKFWVPPPPAALVRASFWGCDRLRGDPHRPCLRHSHAWGTRARQRHFVAYLRH